MPQLNTNATFIYYCVLAPDVSDVLSEKHNLLSEEHNQMIDEIVEEEEDFIFAPKKRHGPKKRPVRMVRMVRMTTMTTPSPSPPPQKKPSQKKKNKKKSERKRKNDGEHPDLSPENQKKKKTRSGKPPAPGSSPKKKKKRSSRKRKLWLEDDEPCSTKPHRDDDDDDEDDHDNMGFSYPTRSSSRIAQRESLAIEAAVSTKTAKSCTETATNQSRRSIAGNKGEVIAGGKPSPARGEGTRIFPDHVLELSVLELSGQAESATNQSRTNQSRRSMAAGNKGEMIAGSKPSPAGKTAKRKGNKVRFRVHVKCEGTRIFPDHCVPSLLELSGQARASLGHWGGNPTRLGTRRRSPARSLTQTEVPQSVTLESLKQANPKDFARVLGDYICGPQETPAQEPQTSMLKNFLAAFHGWKNAVADEPLASQNQPKSHGSVESESESVNLLTPTSALRHDARYTVTEGEQIIKKEVEKFQRALYDSPLLQSPLLRSPLLQSLVPQPEANLKLLGTGARIVHVASKYSSDQITPLSAQAEKFSMHTISSRQINLVMNTLMPLYLLAKDDRKVNEMDTLSTMPTNGRGKGCKRATIANCRGDGEEVAYFNLKEIKLNLLSMRISAGELLVFVDEDNVLGRNPDEKLKWTYILLKEVIPENELFDIKTLADSINPSLQVYFLIVACGYKVYIMEHMENQKKPRDDDSLASASKAKEVDSATKVKDALEEFLAELRTVVENKAIRGMTIDRLGWEKWNILKDAKPGTKDFTFSRFHIAAIILLSGGKSDSFCCDSYLSVMAGIKEPRELLNMMKKDRKSGKTLCLCGLLEAIHESLRPYGLGLSSAQSLLNISVLSLLYFDGGFPTDEILILSMEQFRHKKCRIILNSITNDFAGVGADSHVIEVINILSKEMGHKVTQTSIDNITCHKNCINEDVGYFMNEIIGQIKQWTNKGDNEEKQVCRQIVLQMERKNPFYGRVMRKWLKSLF